MKKLMSLVIAVTILLSGCGKALKVEVSQNIETEYGEELESTKLFDAEKSEENISVKEVKDFDSKKIGEQKITVVFVSDDKTKEEDINIMVKDTKAPEIVFNKESLEIKEGEELDPAKNIKSVKDPVDGDIQLNKDAVELNKKATEQYNKLKTEEIKDNTKVADKILNDFLVEDIKDKEEKNLYLKNCYYIDSNVDAKKAGEYAVKVIAVDINGNRTVKEYKVVVKEQEKQQAEPENSQGKETPVPETPAKKQAATPNQQTPNASSGNSGSQGNSTPSGNGGGGSSTPPPAQNTCVANGTYGRIGNSGRWFNSMQEADDWAWAQLDYGQGEWGKQGYNGFHAWTIIDSCGEERNDLWTVDFY